MLTHDNLLNEIQSLTAYVTTDLSEISSTLDYMETNYNSSFRFFEGVENSLQTLQGVYEKYNLYIYVYIGLSIIGALLAIQIISLLVKAVYVYSLVTSYFQDWHKFCQQRLNVRNERAILVATIPIYKGK